MTTMEVATLLVMLGVGITFHAFILSIHLSLVLLKIRREQKRISQLADNYVKQYDCCETWLKHGYDMGWCTPPVCLMCDGIPMTNREASEEQVCIHGVRLYEDREIKLAVEEDHAPSVWRATNRGWERK